MSNLALWTEGSRSYGSSIAYANYPSRINDGLKDFPGNTNHDTAWTSASEKLPQWAAIAFRRPASVNRIAVYWGRTGDYATSRKFRVECRVGDGWKRVASVSRTGPERMTEVAFDPVTCEAVRLYQGVGGGPEAAPDRMHVAEFEAHGVFVHGPEVDSLKIRDALREEWERNYRELRRPITKEVLARIDRNVKKESLTGPIGQAEMAKARRNIFSTAWGKSLSEKILKDANWWLGIDDAVIYDMIPPENPRAISPSYERGCPIHGGGRKCMRTNTALPYRWQCIEGGEWWYNGAKVRNPTTGETVEVWDDGDGWTSPPGFANPGTIYHFQSAWRYYVLAKMFYGTYELTIDAPEAYTGEVALIRLAYAYAFTGDERYAHKAGVMLNRLAEVYRFFNGTVDEQRPLTRGYLLQVSWEEWPIHDCLVAYDLIMDVMLQDRALLEFFKFRGDCDYNGDGKVDFEDIRHNIHHNLFGTMYEWLHRAMAIQTGDYIIREGLVLAAMGAMLGNQELIEEAIDGPFGLATNLTNNMFRDGKWWYDSPGYSVSCITGMSLERMLSMRGLNLLDDTRLRLREAIEFARNVDCDGRLPGIGDTGGSDSRIKVLNPFVPSHHEELAAIHTGDRAYLARNLALSGGDVDRIRDRYADWMLLFHADPAREENPAPFVPRTAIFHDSGFAILRTGRDLETRKHLVLNYGKGNAGHGHRDKLAINVVVHGYDLSGDLGYPTTFTHKKVDGWEKHTISHATVCIDGKTQAFATGSLELYGRTPGTQVICATGERAYPGLAQVYERTLALIDVSDARAYAFDVFQVRGGDVHDYAFHSLSKDDGRNFEVGLPPGLALTPQEGGTAAGPDVVFGDAPGLGYIKDVSRAKCAGAWSATWRVGNEDGTGIRLTMLGAEGREVITGKGEGYGFFGKSPLDAYVLARSPAKGETTTYVAVLEPFQGHPFIQSVQPLTVSGGVGARVSLDGRTDYLFRRTGDVSVCTSEVEGKQVEFDGAFARVTVHDAGTCDLHLLQGSRLKVGEEILEGPVLPRGRVESVDPTTGAVIVSLSSGEGLAEGDLTVFRNPAYICSSSYEVKTVERLDANRLKIALSLSLHLSEGVVSSTGDDGVFETNTCMTKLEVCPGLFDGKAVYAGGRRLGALESGPGRGAEDRLFANRSGGRNRFRFADPSVATGLKAGDRFLVCDLDVGDTFEGMRSAHNT